MKLQLTKIHKSLFFDLHFHLTSHFAAGKKIGNNLEIVMLVIFKDTFREIFLTTFPWSNELEEYLLLNSLGL